MVNALPDNAATTNVDSSSAIVIGPPLAVNGPTVIGDDGMSSPSGVLGTGSGMGTSKAIEPVDTWSGDVSVGVQRAGGDAIEARVVQPRRGRHHSRRERYLRLVSRNLELLAGGEVGGGDAGRRRHPVEHKVTDRGVWAVQLVGTSQRARDGGWSGFARHRDHR